MHAASRWSRVPPASKKIAFIPFNSLLDIFSHFFEVSQHCVIE